MDTRTCDCCHQDVEFKDRYEEAVTTASDFQEPCNSCVHRNEPATEMPCYFCVHNFQDEGDF